MPEDLNQDPPGEDHSEALAEISEELFGASSEEEGSKPDGREEESPEAGSAAAEVEASPPVTEDKTSEAVQALGAPETWTKEAIAEWATIPPRAQQEILKREQDMFRGIEQYRAAADIGQKYSAVIEPYAPILQAGNIDPVQLVQSFAANHYTLSRGTPEQKASLAASLLDGYGIDLSLLAQQLTSEVAKDPRITALEQQVQSLSSALSQDRESSQAALVNQLHQEITAFAADPQHPYFNELVDDIEKFIAQGASLQEAYDKAVYANPQTRAKEIERLTAEAVKAQMPELSQRMDKKARSRAVNLEAESKARDGAVPLGSLDETLAATMADISSRG